MNLLTQSFDDLDALVDATIASTALLSERITIKPMKARPNHRAVADKTREAVTVRASWFDKPSHWRARHRDVVTTSELAIEFNVAELGGAEIPRQGDVVVRLKTGEEYEVRDIERRGTHLRVTLAERGVY